MAYHAHNVNHSPVNRRFFKRLFDFLDLARRTRDCPALPDALWLEAGVRRCLSLFQSGRDLLQHLADCLGHDINRSTFFESLKSSRRLALLSEILSLSHASLRRELPDPFAAFECLRDFDILAGDGHFIAAACHDQPAPRAAGAPEGATRTAPAKYATGHLYTICLRSHAMGHLDVADQVARRKEHEMRTLKRQTIATLRQGAPAGRKVLYVWDRAGIDFLQWHHWKNRAGICFLSREKENMRPETLGHHPFDSAHAINRGVLSDELVATTRGVAVRRVTWRDPETHTVYVYLTNLPESIPPGLVALLYKARWDVGKVFDEFKNKLGETKAWASSATAKTCHARLLCLTHNLLTLLEEDIRRETGVANVAEARRRSKRLARREADSRKNGCGGVLLLAQGFQRLTQRTVKFIRWLKNHLDSPRSWPHAVARLARVYAHS